jgi:hypothetical protein
MADNPGFLLALFTGSKEGWEIQPATWQALGLGMVSG